MSCSIVGVITFNYIIIMAIIIVIGVCIAYYWWKSSCTNNNTNMNDLMEGGCSTIEEEDESEDDESENNEIAVVPNCFLSEDLSLPPLQTEQIDHKPNEMMEGLIDTFSSHINRIASNIPMSCIKTINITILFRASVLIFTGTIHLFSIVIMG